MRLLIFNTIDRFFSFGLKKSFDSNKFNKWETRDDTLDFDEIFNDELFLFIFFSFNNLNISKQIIVNECDKLRDLNFDEVGIWRM